MQASIYLHLTAPFKSDVWAINESVSVWIAVLAMVNGHVLTEYLRMSAGRPHRAIT